MMLDFQLRSWFLLDMVIIICGGGTMNTERKDRKTKDFKERRRAEEDLWELTSQGGTNFELGSSQGDIFIEFQ